MPTAIIDARDLFRIHRSSEGEAAALQGLTLHVDPGEVVAVLGPSGAGKSTLMRILAGLERPSAGSARVLGHDMAELRPRHAAALRARSLGIVDQHYHRSLPPELPCREIIGLQLAMLGVARPDRDRRAAELLERVGLTDAAESTPGRLSGGEQQRIAICAAVAHRPALLLADEPAGELDAQNVSVAYHLIAELARDDGATVVLVSHDPAATSVADRTLHIRDGRLSDESSGTGATSIVVGRGGWLRVPEELLADAGVGRLARAERHEHGILITPAGPAAARAEPEPAAAQARAAAVSAETTIAAVMRGVGMRYGEGRRARVVLDGFDATFDTGRMTALTGRSGSGKSTVLRLLAGMEHPTSGEVVVLGMSVGGLDRAEAAAFRRSHVGVVAQEAGLVDYLSAIENVTLAMSVRGRGEGEEAAETARTWLGRFGLEHRLEHRVARLSAGERQRVAIARAMACAPDLLLVDEPTSRLDQANAAVVGRMLADAAQQHGATIICATHDPLVTEQADRVLPLEPGA
ncbi:MAG TPA: ABC transporter ATP-binding protein [Gaiellales bacterium]|jgi:ABC-type lipoprotein export system ATPase subunit